MKSRVPALGTQPRCLHSEPAAALRRAPVPHGVACRGPGTGCREGWVKGCIHRQGAGGYFTSGVSETPNHHAAVRR